MRRSEDGRCHNHCASKNICFAVQSLGFHANLTNNEIKAIDPFEASKKNSAKFTF
jgi:hypothetical protein